MGKKRGPPAEGVTGLTTIPGPRESYSDQQRAEAVAVLYMSPSIERAQELLRELWGPAALIPSHASLSIWSRDPRIEPDAGTITILDRERKLKLGAHFHAFLASMAARFQRDVEKMAWRDVKDAMVAFGILADKLVGHTGGERGIGTAAVNVTFNMGNGPPRQTWSAASEETASIEATGTPMPDGPAPLDVEADRTAQ